MESPETSMSDFSKHLLVVIFAIFAFTSSTLLDSPTIYVKFTYILSLSCAILSMYYGFETILCSVNEKIERYQDTKYQRITLVALSSMKKNLQSQYYFSLLSLILLAITIVLYFLFALK